MQFNQRRLNGKFYYNYLKAKTKSLDGNIGAWMYVTGSFTEVYRVANRKEAGDTLRRFTDDAGIPYWLRTELASYLTGNNT